MLSWFRALNRTIALTVLVSLTGLVASSALPHEDDCHDPSCVISDAPHDPSQHAVGNPSPPADHPLHCVMCHWTRLHRPSIGAVHQFAPTVARHDRVPVEADAIVPISRAAQPPLRSPPDIPVPVV